MVAHSLKRMNTIHKIVTLITNSVTQSMRHKLQSVCDEIVLIETMNSKDEINLSLLNRPELRVTLSKLHCWNLTQYKKCVFLDADVLVLKNCDELFDYEEFSAAPDVGWPDCFNSGVFVFQPSVETFKALKEFASKETSFDGADQGLLNSYFSDWAHGDIKKHLPFIYNTCSTATYSYLPAFKQFRDKIKIMHFIGKNKPWTQFFDSKSCKVYPVKGIEYLTEYYQLWWDIFCENVLFHLDSSMSGVAGSLSQIKLGEENAINVKCLENLHRENWESGHIDYMGKDSFDNIWSRICSTLSKDDNKN